MKGAACGSRECGCGRDVRRPAGAPSVRVPRADATLRHESGTTAAGLPPLAGGLSNRVMC
jgi:hypothetical protein